MIHVFKLGGPWKRGNIEYTIKAINECRVNSYLEDNWFLTLAAAVASKQLNDSIDDKFDDNDVLTGDNYEALKQAEKTTGTQPETKNKKPSKNESSEEKKARLSEEIKLLGGTPPKSGSVAKFEQELLQVKSKA